MDGDTRALVLIALFAVVGAAYVAWMRIIDGR